MIRLSKNPIPDVLRVNSSVWTAELMAVIGRNEEPTATQKGRYRHAEIKGVLVEETWGKCAYCESKLLHIAYGDVEHIVPKSLEPELSFIWANLTLACDVCNTNKGNGEGLIDPYVDDPAMHFMFLGAFIFSLPVSEIGKLTEVVLQLNRVSLIERRLEMIKELHLKVVNIASTRDDRLRKLLIQELLTDAVSDDKEYSACARACINIMRANGAIPEEP